MLDDRTMRRAECRLPGETEQVSAARRFVTNLVGDGWLDIGDAALLTGELANNAVLHSASGLPGGKFVVRVIVRPFRYLLVEVEDEGGPWLETVGDDDERGRGLQIIRVLANEWSRAGSAETGWIVWARIDWAESPKRVGRAPGPAGPMIPAAL